MNPFSPAGFKPMLFAGSYLLQACLGQGGSGTVYKARHIRTGRWVALKVLQTGELADERRALELVARFQREIRLTAGLHHPHIVRPLDSGVIDERILYTVSEYIDGPSLAALLSQEGRLPPPLAARLMRQVLEALAYAHDQGLVHRDLKPHNLAISGTGEDRKAHLLDFGLATIVEGARPQDFTVVTETGVSPGTPAYAAPEQLRGLEVTTRADLYAWGLVFLECLTGRPVMAGGSSAEVYVQQLSPAPIPLPAPIDAHPLGRLLDRALAREPAERAESARALIDMLDACDLRDLELG